MTLSGKGVGKPLPHLTHEQQREVYYFTVFPSLFVSLHPDYVLTHRIQRIAADQTRIECQIHVDPHDDSITPKSLRDAAEFWDQTNRQDWEVCELTQSGVASSGYVPGPYSDAESLLAAFDRHYLDQLAVEEDR